MFRRKRVPINYTMFGEKYFDESDLFNFEEFKDFMNESQRVFNETENLGAVH